MGDLIQMRDFKRPEERGHSTSQLREIGLQIINSPEFQADLAKSPMEPAPFDPVAVAIMRGYYSDGTDTAPSEMPPVQPSYQAPEQDPA